MSILLGGRLAAWSFLLLVLSPHAPRRRGSCAASGPPQEPGYRGRSPLLPQYLGTAPTDSSHPSKHGHSSIERTINPNPTHNTRPPSSDVWLVCGWAGLSVEPWDRSCSWNMENVFPSLRISILFKSSTDHLEIERGARSSQGATTLYKRGKNKPCVSEFRVLVHPVLTPRAPERDFSEFKTAHAACTLD